MKGVVPAWNKVHSDFANYYVSAKLIADKAPLENIYNNQWFQNKIKDYEIETLGKFSPFPPVTAWIMLPLTPFEPLTAQRIFTVINLIFIGIGVVVLKKLITWPVPQCALFILGCGLGLINNVAFGQVYLIMTASIMISFLLFRNNQFFLAGIILGFFTALKYFPIVVIAGFLLNGLTAEYQKERPFKQILTSPDLKVAMYSIISFIVLLVMQYAFFGRAVMHEFFISSFVPHLDGRLSGQDSYSFYYQSWNDLFMRVFVYHEQFNPNPIIDWSPGLATLKVVIGLLVLFMVSKVLYKFRAAPAAIRRSVYISLPALAVFVLLPVSATYHCALLIASLVLLMKDSLLNKKDKILIFFVYGGLGLIPYSLIFRLSETLGFWFAYPRLWLISILFILVFIAIMNIKEYKTELK